MLAILAFNPQHFARASLKLAAQTLNRHQVTRCAQHLDAPFKMERNRTAQCTQWKHPDFSSSSA
jgi:hypothetical protein